MVIGTRVLTIRGPVADIPGAGPARAPEDTDGHGICRFTIGRPEEPRENFGAGVDALRAVHLAMQRTGIDLKVSAAHETGTRVGAKPGHGPALLFRRTATRVRSAWTRSRGARALRSLCERSEATRHATRTGCARSWITSCPA
jgi:hypothetical protein